MNVNEYLDKHHEQIFNRSVQEIRNAFETGRDQRPDQEEVAALKAENARWREYVIEAEAAVAADWKSDPLVLGLQEEVRRLRRVADAAKTFVAQHRAGSKHPCYLVFLEEALAALERGGEKETT